MQVRNNVTLIGNLGSAPETNVLPSGNQVTSLSLATNEYYKDKEGNRQSRTEWHRVKAFGKLAELFAEHLTKGSQVCIAGALRYNKWIDKHDQVRTTAEIIASEFTFLSPGKHLAEDASPPTAEKPARRKGGKKKAAPQPVQEVGDDSVPF
ncbi:MAG: single-stranded DNA-binding protein [Bacteroidota bacterium]